MEFHQYCNRFALFLCMFWLLLITSSADSAWSSVSQDEDPRKLGAADWLNHGGDLYNRRYASNETEIRPDTASGLRLRWEFHAGKDITVTPAIFNGTLYFPSWNGYLYAVKASDGALVWKQYLQNLTGLNASDYISNVNWTVSRATPTVAGNDMLIVGIYGPAVVIAVDRATGRLLWSTQVDSNPGGAITMSGTFHNGSFYVGTSSFEEKYSIEKCCIFRGSLSKLDAKTGAILWQTFVLPDNLGKRGEYAGAAIWGSSPSIDVQRNHVYVATGNLYSAPKKILECQEKENNQTVPTQPDPCIEPDNHSNSILAFDLDSGKIKWYRQLGGYDLWFFACDNLSTPNCPPGPNPDADFGEAPMMLSISLNGTMLDIVVAVQKSGYAWALDRDDGSLVWYNNMWNVANPKREGGTFMMQEAGPGGETGGGTWGAATDGKRVYTNIVNSNNKNFTLKPSNKNTTTGGWVAMDANTGKTLWAIANPSNASANGPVTIANGVLFAGSTHRAGPVYAVEAGTGRVIWSHNTSASVFGGASVSSGCVYIGSGYNVNNGPIWSFTGGTSLFAFCLP